MCVNAGWDSGVKNVKVRVNSCIFDWMIKLRGVNYTMQTFKELNATKV
jgi:hypothetical protein